MTILLAPTLEADNIGWYLAPSFDPLLLKDAVGSSPFLATKGRGGRDLLAEIRLLADRRPAILDPAQNEAALVRNGRSQRKGWAELEESLDAAALVSPGTYLAEGMSRADAAAALRAERDWARLRKARRRRVFAAVAVDRHFLRDRVDELIAAFRNMDCDIWLTLSGRDDPLSLQGAVEALVRLVMACPRVAVMRCDIGALGGLAFGALMGSIGLTGGVRHSPDGGGGTGNDIPVIYVRTLQSFKKTDLLQSWVQRDADIEHHLSCDEGCCEGQSILRYADPAFASEATIHNMLSLRVEIDAVRKLDHVKRPAKFISLATHALFQHEWMRDTLGKIKVDPQLRQWADLRS